MPRLVSLLLPLALLLTPTAHAAQRLTDWVDPFIGTGGIGFGIGSAYPGPATPFGMIHPGPDTTRGGNHPGFYHCSGYYYKDTQIRGFSHTRMHGTGVEDYGNILMMPTRGKAADMVREENRWSKFTHKSEEASPGYYAVTLADTGIRVELTTGERAAIHRYTFPKADDALVVVDAGHFIVDGKPVASEVLVEPDKKAVSGWFDYQGPMTGRGGSSIKTYFVVQSQTPFAGFGTWSDGTYRKDSPSAEGTGTGAVLHYTTKDGQQLQFRVAISFISVQKAWENLLAEVPGDPYAFDALRATTEASWETLLSRARIQTKSKKHKRIFYTALYHSFLMPTLFTEAGGQYVGLDKEVHTARDFRYYTDFSLWDTFRTLHPLLTLLTPEHQRDMSLSLMAMFDEGGALPRWPIGTSYSGTMIGDPAAITLVDTVLHNIDGVDGKRVYDIVRKSADGDHDKTRFGGRGGDVAKINAQGYLAADETGGATSKTLEYAYADHAVAVLAARLGKKDDAARFAKRARTYKNVFNPKVGFMDGRNKDGSWVTPFDDQQWQKHFTEGTAWQWLWFAPHDPEGLITLLGGPEKFTEKLDAFFTGAHKRKTTMGNESYYWHGNEPDIHAPFLYHWVNRPDRMSEEVRWILLSKYDDEPDGLDGNDDAGTLSAWFAFAAMGLYPLPATGRYVLSSPLFTKSTLDLGGGKTLTIHAPDVSPNNKYLTGATWNGKKLEQPWLTVEQVMAGGKLVLNLESQPAKFNGN